MTRPLLEIQRLLCLSTGHVAAEVAAELDGLLDRPLPAAAARNPTIWQAHIVLARWQDYGWFVWVGSGARTHMPRSLSACLDLAERVAARWVLFDRDVAPIATLPTYDW